MLVKIRRGWELPDSAATPEAMFHDRRRLLKAVAAGPVLLAASGLLAACDQVSDEETGAASRAAQDADPSAHLYPFKRNPRYVMDRALTPESLATSL